MNSFLYRVFLAASDYFDGDAKRIQHFTKVLQFSDLIAYGENLSGRERDILLCAAVLHDIGIPESERKYGDCTGRHQEEEGPPVARSILAGLGADETLTETVCRIISLHHSYDRVGDDRLLRILIEADLLVNSYEDYSGVCGTDNRAAAHAEIAAAANACVRTATGKRLFASLYNVEFCG